MIQSDYFGLNRELKIIDSKVRNIFTPHQPIKDLQHFYGREPEVARIIEYLNTPGQHALLYGDRGVGKSSIANIACDLLIGKIITGKLYKKRCDSYDNFSTIMREPLNECGIDIDLFENEKTSSRIFGSDNSIFPTFSKFGKTTTAKSQGNTINSLSPSWVCDKIKDLDGILLIDEFEIISQEEDKNKIAQLIKQLSDEGSKFKLFIIGIAESSAELISGHASVQRCLKETRLSRMTEAELSVIVTTGAKKLNLNFHEIALRRIVKVSSGYPHFTHLLALKASEDAIIDDRDDVSLQNIVDATKRAVDDSEGSLKQSYDNATRSSTSDVCKRILLAAACCNAEEFRAIDLREKFKQLFGQVITQGYLNNYFQRIVSSDNSFVLRRIAQGIYRFNDPRMPSFIKIAQSFIETD